jgi:3-oxoadipate enol-lactonase
MTPQHATNGDHQTAFWDSAGSNTKGGGPALVFAHGLGFDHSIWDATIAGLPPGLRVVRYDLRGHGQSDTPPAPYTMGALIRDAETLLDHLCLRDVVFIGHGLGGMVAQGLAVKRLDQIRALVLANTAPKLGTKETWARDIAQTQASGLDARLDRDIQRSFAPAFRKIDALAPWRALLRDRRLDGFLGCAHAIAGSDFYTPTASLRLPCLIVAGGQDAITPADMVQDLAQLIPGARVALIRPAGHLPMIETPQACASVLIDFLHAIGHS